MSDTNDRQSAPSRPRGRPRSRRADRAILKATLELLAEVGYEALTMEEVAARAGVGKGTLYRRFPSKLELLLDVGRRVTEERIPLPDTGSLRGDLAEILGTVIRTFMETPMGRILPGLVSAAARDPSLGEAFRGFFAERRRLMFEAIRRGAERGEFRSDADPELVADMLYGALHYRLLIRQASLSEVSATELVDLALRGTGALDSR